MMQLSQLAERGLVHWPDGGEAPWVPQEFDQVAPGSPRLVELLGRPLQQMTEDELVELWCEVSVLTRREGILALEPLLDGCVSPFLREGLRLVIDGTEPAVIAEILKTRSERVLIPQQETRCGMVLEGMTAILAGAHPAFVRHKLSAFYETEDSLKGAGADRPSAAALAKRIGELRLTEMSFSTVTVLFVELAYVARAEGREALRPLLELANEPFRRGLQLVCEQVEPVKAREVLEAALDEGLRQARARHRMAIAGNEAVQLGKEPELVARQVREAAASA
jgi:flagellar motor component MotA